MRKNLAGIRIYLIRICVKIETTLPRKLRMTGVAYKKNKKARNNGVDRDCKVLYECSDNNTFKIEEPSRGGIGKRLKIIKIKLICMAMNNMIFIRSGSGKKLIKSAKITAKSKLLSGPAKAIFISSHLDFRLLGLIGTGFPQPNPTKKSMTVPNKSKCAKGFKEILPAYLAVGSPK